LIATPCGRRLGGRVTTSSQSATAPLANLSVVLVATRNPLNMGAAARAMSNFGCLSLRVVRPWTPAFRDAKSAVGAVDLLANAQEFETLAEAVADCSLVVGTTSVGHRELEQPIHPLPQGAAIIQGTPRSGRVALLFGSEKVGLSNDDLSHCHWLMRIPTREQHSSMNLGQAVAVCLYELARQPDVAVTPAAGLACARHPESSIIADSGMGAVPASGAVMERFTAALLDLLTSSGYFEPVTISLGRQKIRRLVHRLQPSTEDAELWLGMLRQILWKIRSPGRQDP
jgi:TrmH family RNA methyltransferase